MSMSSNGAASMRSSVPVTSFSYRDMGAPVPLQANEAWHAGSDAEQEREPPKPPGMSTQEVNDLLNQARVEAVAATESSPQVGI